MTIALVFSTFALRVRCMPPRSEQVPGRLSPAAGPGRVVRFVCVFTIAHGSHGQDSLLLSLSELVTKRRVRPATVLDKALAAKGVKKSECPGHC
jgi:hypothetical protein